MNVSECRAWLTRAGYGDADLVVEMTPSGIQLDAVLRLPLDAVLRLPFARMEGLIRRLPGWPEAAVVEAVGEGFVLECPNCGSHDLVFLEGGFEERALCGIRVESGWPVALLVDRDYEVGGNFGDGANERLYCRVCTTSLSLPATLEIEFVNFLK